MENTKILYDDTDLFKEPENYTYKDNMEADEFLELLENSLDSFKNCSIRIEDGRWNTILNTEIKPFDIETDQTSQSITITLGENKKGSLIDFTLWISDDENVRLHYQDDGDSKTRSFSIDFSGRLDYLTLDFDNYEY